MKRSLNLLWFFLSALAVAALICAVTFLPWSSFLHPVVKLTPAHPATVTALREEFPGSLHQRESRTPQMVQVYHASVSDRLKFLLGELGDGRYSTRQAALLDLGQDLDAVEVATLLTYLANPMPSQNLKPNEEAALKNDVINLLRRQIPPARQLEPTLLKMVSDSAQPEVMQDYALQNLSVWYHEGASAAEKTEIAGALWLGTLAEHGSIPGTSMLALSRLIPANDNKDLKKLGQAALGKIQASNLDVAATITALQICGKLHLAEATGTALNLAQSVQTPMPIRISAVAALGDLGDRSNQPLLESWAQGQEQRLRVPAQSALQRMSKRLSL